MESLSEERVGGQIFGKKDSNRGRPAAGSESTENYVFEVRGLFRSSGEPDLLPATRQTCLQNM